MRWGVFLVFFFCQKSPFPHLFLLFSGWVWLFKKQFFERNIDFFSGVFFEGTFDGDVGGKNAFATKTFDSCGRTDANTEFPRVSAFGGVDVGIATYLPAIIQIFLPRKRWRSLTDMSGSKLGV